jgi:peptidoglycan/xylan/chitin deacetylase (PgdA/CDA1 family)
MVPGKPLIEPIGHAAGEYGGFSFGGQQPEGVSVHRPLPGGTLFPEGARAALLLTFDVEGNYGNGIGDVDREIARYAEICGRLREREIPATFNVVGKLVEEHGGECIEHMVDAGCEVACHGYVHDMNDRYGGERVYAGHYGPVENTEQVQEGIRVLNSVLSRFGSGGVRGMRFPYGHFNEFTYEAAEAAGLSWTSNVGMDDFTIAGQGFGNMPFLMKLGERVYDLVEIPLDSQTYDWTVWVADEAVDGPFVEALRRYCSGKELPLSRSPRGAVQVWRERIHDTLKGGGIFTMLCHPINCTLRSDRWEDPVQEFLFPVIDLLSDLRDAGQAWVCTCGQLAELYRRQMCSS